MESLSTERSDRNLMNDVHKVLIEKYKEVKGRQRNSEK